MADSFSTIFAWPPEPLSSCRNLINNGEVTEQYDFLNRLQNFIRGGQVIADHECDAKGRCIRKLVTDSCAFDGFTDFYYHRLQEP